MKALALAYKSRRGKIPEMADPSGPREDLITEPHGEGEPDDGLDGNLFAHVDHRDFVGDDPSGPRDALVEEPHGDMSFGQALAKRRRR